MPGVISFLRQLFPPAPRFIERDLPDLRGKVYIVTGSNVGLGKELARLLYSKHATVYMACRSEDKALGAIHDIKQAHPASDGTLVFLRLDLADLTTISASALEYLAKETHLHGLFNNAGLGPQQDGAVTAQGYDMQLGTNCLGPFLFTKLLTDIMVATAATSAPGSVRVVWTSSSAAEGISTKDYIDNLDFHLPRTQMDRYYISKLGNHFHSAEFASRHKSDGVISVALNPGNLDSDFWRDSPVPVRWIMRHTVLHPPLYGAYTSIFAGFSPLVTMDKSGSFLAPWGRFWELRDELVTATISKEEGGAGLAQDFWTWSENEVKKYL